MNWIQMGRRAAAMLLCLTMLLSCVATAYADTLACTNKKTTVYVEANGALKKAGTVAKGTEVTILDINGEWAKVKKDGKVAYMKRSALTEQAAAVSAEDDVVTCDKYIYAAVEGVIVYEKDDIESEQLTVLSKGTRQRMVAYSDDWCMVKNGKYYGYVLRDEMSLEPIAAATATPAATPTAQPQNEVTQCRKSIYAAVDGVKVYKSDSTSAKVQDTLALGQKVTMTAYTDTWCQIKSGSKVGYVLRDEMSLTKVAAATPAPTATPAATPTAQPQNEVTQCRKSIYAAVDGVKVYKSDSTSAKVQDTLTLGQKVTMTAYTDTWCQIKAGSKVGYVLRDEMSLTKVAAATPTPTATPAATQSTGGVTACNKSVYVANDGAKVYAKASTSAKVQDTLALGQKLTMTGYTDTWCQVKSGSKTGYMLRSDLSLEPVATATPVPTATPTVAPTATPGVTACNKDGYAVEDGVKVYAKADTGSKVLDTLDKNEKVNVTGYTDKWCQVKNGSKVGYVLLEKLSETEIVDMPTELKYGDTGEAVKRLQQRLKELGYFNGTIGGNYLAQTRTAVMTFQAQNDLEADGTAGPATLKKLFSADAKPYDPSQNTSTSTGGSTASGPSNALVQEMDWWTSDIQKIFSRGTTATVTDCSTGISWKERRSGGTNHADVQPVTAADTAAMLSAVGSWSWNRRAVWVTIDGKNYAASMNCMPHGSGSITDNDFDGHHCIHFTNSRTHGSNKVCSLHQAAIKKALKYNPK